jgi:hypothetical protein
MQQSTITIIPMGQRSPNPFELKLIALALADMTRTNYLNSAWVEAQRSGAVIEVSPDGHARVIRAEDLRPEVAHAQ